MQPETGVPVSPFTGVPGWETDAEEEALRGLAAAVPDGAWIVELGSEYGRSAATFCDVAKPTVQIVSVDLWPEDHPLVGSLAEAYKTNLTEAGFARRTLAIKGDSSLVGTQWIQGPIHLLFVDADHTYAGVKADIAAWERHVPAGGFIAFHDCAHGDQPHTLHLEVSRAVDEWMSLQPDPHRWQLFGIADSLRVYRRRY